MKDLGFEVRAGRPTEVVVQREDGKRASVFVSLNVLRVRETGVTDADGDPEYAIDFNVSIVNAAKSGGTQG